MLVLPDLSRAVLRAGLGVRIRPGAHQRIAAWLLLTLGLVIMVIGRLAR